MRPLLRLRLLLPGSKPKNPLLKGINALSIEIETSL